MLSLVNVMGEEERFCHRGKDWWVRNPYFVREEREMRKKRIEGEGDG